MIRNTSLRQVDACGGSHRGIFVANRAVARKHAIPRRGLARAPTAVPGRGLRDDGGDKASD